MARLAGSGTRTVVHDVPKVHWLSKEPMPVCHLKSKFSGAPTVLAPRSMELTLPAKTSDSVKFPVVAPGARSPPPPPAQFGPVERHKSTVWNDGKFWFKNVVNIALVSDPLIATGLILNPTAVRRADGNNAAFVRLLMSIVMVNVVFVPLNENAKLLKVTVPSSCAGPPVIEVGTMSSIVNAEEPACTTFAFAGLEKRTPTRPPAIARAATPRRRWSAPAVAKLA